MSAKFDHSEEAYQAWLVAQANEGIIWDGLLLSPLH